MTRVIVAGSRGIADYCRVKSFLDRLLATEEFFKLENIVIISGAAKGVDQLGERYAAESQLSLEVYPAQWNTYGKSAGYKRNEQMGQRADAAIIFWDGESKGTRHMMDYMQTLGKPAYVITPDDNITKYSG